MCLGFVVQFVLVYSLWIQHLFCFLSVFPTSISDGVYIVFLFPVQPEDTCVLGLE